MTARRQTFPALGQADGAVTGSHGTPDGQAALFASGVHSILSLTWLGLQGLHKAGKGLTVFRSNTQA